MFRAELICDYEALAKISFRERDGWEHGDGEGRPRVARGDESGRLVVAHELGRHAQRRVALAAQRLRRALAHADDLGRVADFDARSGGAEPRQLALDGGGVADEDHGGSELADRGERAFDDHGGAVVPSHGINGDLHYAPSTATISRPL